MILLNRTTTVCTRARKFCPPQTRILSTTSSPPKTGLHHLFAWYTTKLETHPLTTKCISSGIIAGAGDFFSQYYVFQKQNEGKDGDTRNFKDHWDANRNFRFAFLGFALIAPTMHHWYGALMRYIPEVSMKGAIIRSSIDQFLFVPFFLPTWLVSNMALQMHDWQTINAKLKKDYWELLKANWALWFPAQMINLGYVPARFQVLFGNVVGLLWMAYLSFKTGAKKTIEMEEMKEDTKQTGKRKST